MQELTVHCGSAVHFVDKLALQVDTGSNPGGGQDCLIQPPSYLAHFFSNRLSRFRLWAVVQ